ncbi:Ger(x)C family spore germination protein [Paenibacillus sp. HN-1]|uniref:Ger(x)C family spore germination protein n=1 Tax=Paenibacillus TaxID=44249 RepID=UPI001CA992AE|nr:MULTISPECIES: Ger(x)C family spore germination protein [Paenibacillus]MBY9081156.1 Ger(x)C family spore germination protein [Paenibacillus sp. CGMCC 1.18879]MBY9087193.1 Ger(x)C family spore germination protein [Paenibacillus sinensis]
MSRGTRKVHKAGSLLLVLILMSMTVSGCWDDRELSELGIVSASAYDWEDNHWKATYQVINPSSGASGMGGGGSSSTSSPPFLTFTVRGSTIMQAIERSNLTSTRQMFFSHSRITVISEKLAKRGLSQLIDMFMRRPEARETVYMFIAEGEAGRLLSQLMQFSKSQGAGIQLMIEQEATQTSFYPGTRVFELAMQLTSESECGTIPELKLTGNKVMDKTDDTAQTDMPSRMDLGRLAVMKKDRFAGWLSQREAFGLSFMTDKIKMTNLSFSSIPGESDKDDASIILQHSSTTVRPVWTNDHYVMDIDIHGGGILSEIGSKLDLTKESSIARMERSIEANIVDIVKDSWASIQKMNADATGFAISIHRHDPKRWKKIKKEDSWDSVFRNIEIRPHVKIKIERIGLGNKSYKSLEPSGK